MRSVRHVLVSGSSRGIGRALVEHFLEAGDMVTGCSRSEDCEIRHERYVHVMADVSNETSVRDLFRRVRERSDHLDAVVNNAGSARMVPIALTPAETMRRVLDTNFVGTFMLTRHAIGLLRASDAGRVVNLTSIAVPLRLDGEAIYAAAKSAVESFTRSTARELGPFGITCNAVGPSPIRTRLLDHVPEHKLKALIERQAIARWAEPTDVVNVVEFFLRPSSAMVTGQVLYLGGIA